MHLNHLPGAQQKRFWQKKWPREVLFNGPPIIVAGLAAGRALFERDDVVEIVGAGTKAISDFVTKRY